MMIFWVNFMSGSKYSANGNFKLMPLEDFLVE